MVEFTGDDDRVNVLVPVLNEGADGIVGSGKNRDPINDPAFPPRLEPKPADDQTFLHGLLLGMSAVEALAYNRLDELGGPVLRSLRTVGGGAKNSVWTALRQKKIPVPILNIASDQAAAGAARLAWKGLLSS